MYITPNYCQTPILCTSVQEGRKDDHALEAGSMVLGGEMVGERNREKECHKSCEHHGETLETCLHL